MELSAVERRELDVWLAVNLFGWSEIEPFHNLLGLERVGWPPKMSEAGKQLGKMQVPRYSEDLNAAQQVVARMNETLTLREYPYKRAYATFGDWDDESQVVEANGRYCAATAICLAAKKMFEQQGETI
ncbi:MAG: hypothetical protein FOGNACKC_00733 [Anaerolineae bacterium]|nr:hypothetical protein [Anaerolineae bacterium]